MYFNNINIETLVDIILKAANAIVKVYNIDFQAEYKVFINELKKGHGKIKIVSAGSSLKFCLVAEGKADIYPRFGPTMEWDTAAGQIIVEETGGIVKDVRNCHSLKYNKDNLVNPPFIVKSKSYSVFSTLTLNT